MPSQRALVLLASCAVLSACGPAAAVPTIDQVSMKATVTLAVQATPTVLTPSPEPIRSPLASTIVATTAPAAVPPDWTRYQSITDLFSLSYPPGWNVQHEQPNSVSLAGPNFANLHLGFYQPECGLLEGVTDAAILNCLTAKAAGTFPTDAFTLARKALWTDGHYHGYTVEYQLYDYAYRNYTYVVDVYVPMPSPHLMLSCNYFRVGTSSLTRSERAIIEGVVRSFRGPDLVGN